nr:hypothetical protein [Clostridia bacterium]
KVVQYLNKANSLRRQTEGTYQSLKGARDSLRTLTSKDKRISNKERMAALGKLALTAGGMTFGKFPGKHPLSGKLGFAAKNGSVGKAKVALKKTPANKRNPGGRKGGPEHRAKVDQTIKKLSNKGWTIRGGGKDIKEEYIRGPKGTKGSNYVDITATKKGKTLRIQVGKQTTKGKPIKRERVNLEKIRKQTDIPGKSKTIFAAYNKNNKVSSTKGSISKSSSRKSSGASGRSGSSSKGGGRSKRR